MNDATSTIRQLSQEQTKSLLALGLLSPSDHTARRTVQIVRQAAAAQGGVQLRQLRTDLQSPVLLDGSPLALDRLTCLEARDRRSLMGKTFLEAVKSSRTTAGVLDSLAELGRRLGAPTFPEATQLFGIALRALAQAALAAHHQVDIDGLDETLEILETLNLAPSSFARPPNRRGTGP